MAALGAATLIPLLLAPTAAADHISDPEEKRVVVLRVHFADYPDTSRYTRGEVQGFFDQLDGLWQNTSYGAIAVTHQVSDLIDLPSDRNRYVTDYSNGDLSEGDQFDDLLWDAIGAAPDGLDWGDLDAVFVVMAETDTTQFHRGQASGSCNLPMGPGGDVESVGCGIFSENPSNSDLQIWGRWAHELGHAFQEGGPAHPGNYNNDFELMDANYPGHTGVFEKQANQGFPGWLPAGKYQTFDPLSGGGIVSIWAREHDPSERPNYQALRVEVTEGLYYLVSLAKRIQGDELNGYFTPNGIPDEGVLIERVVEGGDPAKLWKPGDHFSLAGDGVHIWVLGQPAGDPDSYTVKIAYDDQANKPDVALMPWRSPPGNTYETTDIWIDSPVNGYGTYRYGSWDDLAGGVVPVENGDDPAIGLVNRVYARVRNVGSAPATDVTVEVQRADPLGVGIAGSNGWITIGTVDAGDFSGLALVEPGASVDVYVEWTPSVALPEDLAEGDRFRFHSCLRVRLGEVEGETVFGNQDGDDEQENIRYFELPADSTGGDDEPDSEAVITLRNDDLDSGKHFRLHWEDDLPEGWSLEVNGGAPGVELGPNEARGIPVRVHPDATGPAGGSYFVDVSASSLRQLVNERDPTDTHPEYATLGGVRVEFLIVEPTTVDCRATADGSGVRVGGRLQYEEKLVDPKQRLSVLAVGIMQSPDGKRSFLPYSEVLMPLGKDGAFAGELGSKAHETVTEVACLFAGTRTLASAAATAPIVEEDDEGRTSGKPLKTTEFSKGSTSATNQSAPKETSPGKPVPTLPGPGPGLAVATVLALARLARRNR